MKILCIADIHGNTEKIENLKELNPDIILVAGDITNFGGAKQASLVIDELLRVCSTIFAVPGNCDYPEVLNFLEEKGISLHGRSVKINEIGIFGVGGTNPTPFATPFEISENEIAKFLKNGYESVKNCEIKILLSHAPPFGILDKTSSGLHVGSKAIREFLENNKVNYAVSGHIHESSGVAKFNDTIVINPGNLSAGCCVIDLNENKVERVDFI